MRAYTRSSGAFSHLMRGFSHPFVAVSMGIIAATILVLLAAFELYTGLSTLQASLIQSILDRMGLWTLRLEPWTILVSKDHVITIILTRECIGIYSLTVYSLLVLTTPGRRGADKAMWLAGGSALLFTANILRIAASAVVGAEAGVFWFRVFHDVLGSAFMLGTVIALLVDWLHRTK